MLQHSWTGFYPARHCHRGGRGLRALTRGSHPAPEHPGSGVCNHAIRELMASHTHAHTLSTCSTGTALQVSSVKPLIRIVPSPWRAPASAADGCSSVKLPPPRLHLYYRSLPVVHARCFVSWGKPICEVRRLMD